MASVQSKAASASGEINALGSAGASAGLSLAEMAGSATAAIGVVTLLADGFKKAYDFSEQGAELQRVSDGFTSVANSYDVNSQNILDSMRRASNGTISDQDLMLASSRAMLLGVSTDADQLGQITEAAIARGRAMGLSSAESIDKVFTGIGRLSPKILDDLGIVTNATKRYEDYARAHGTTASALDDYTKRQIIADAVIQDSQKLLGKSGQLANDNASSFERLSSSWQNFTNNMKLSSAGTFTPLNNFLSDMLDSQARKQQTANAYQEYLKSYKGAGFDDPNNPMLSMDAFAKQQASRQASAARYTGMAQMYASQSPKASAPVDTTDYGNVLKVSTALTDVTGKYNDKLNQLAEKLIDAPKKFGATAEQADALKANLTSLDNMTGEYNTTLMQQLQQLTTAEGAYGKNDARVRELREGINKLKEDMTAANNEMLMGTMKNAGATDQQQLNFARASGMISEQAFQQSLALSKISEAYLSNKITADQAAQASRNVANGLSSIQGFNAVGYVDIYIRTHGSVSYGGVSYAANSVGGIAMSEATGNRKGNAVGGPVGANEISGITEYGEPEIYSSGGKQYLISGKRGGYVSPMNAQSGGSWQQLHAVVSRIPTAEETARALVKALKSV